MGIILKWRGEPFDEASLHAGATPRGHDFGWAAHELKAELVTPALAIEEFRQHVPLWFAEDHALIIKVCGPAYVKHLGQTPGGYPSRHGDLAHPGDWGEPRHAIVLIGQTATGFLALDPYYPALGQPLQITDDILGEVFINSVVVCRR